MSEPITVEQAIGRLNEINEMDPTVLPALINFRVPCNQALADHPTVQVGHGQDGYEVGLLGILNGIFGADERGWGHIYMQAEMEPNPDPSSDSSTVKRIRRFSGRTSEPS